MYFGAYMKPIECSTNWMEKWINYDLLALTAHMSNAIQLHQMPIHCISGENHWQHHKLNTISKKNETLEKRKQTGTNQNEWNRIDIIEPFKPVTESFEFSKNVVDSSSWLPIFNANECIYMCTHCWHYPLKLFNAMYNFSEFFMFFPFFCRVSMATTAHWMLARSLRVNWIEIIRIIQA